VSARHADAALRDRRAPSRSSLTVGYATAWLRQNTKQPTGPLKSGPWSGATSGYGSPGPAIPQRKPGLFRRDERTKKPIAGDPGIGAQFVSFNFTNSLICKIVSSAGGFNQRPTKSFTRNALHSLSLVFVSQRRGAVQPVVPVKNRRITGRFLSAAQNRGAERAFRLIHRSRVRRIFQAAKTSRPRRTMDKKKPGTVSRPGAARQFQFHE
jgi:hypothetical protein